MNYDTIIVLDFGSQYNQLIVRRLRKVGVYAELWAHDVPIKSLRASHIKGIVLSGGPHSVIEVNAMKMTDEFWDLDKPILGICYGMQLMMHTLGGKVDNAEKAEYGAADLHIKEPHNPLFLGVEDATVWMSHQDKTLRIPTSWRVVACTKDCEAAAVSDKDNKYWGIQFHPEVSHTVFGMQILKNFVLNICKVHASWSMVNYVSILEQEIKEQVGDSKVICGLSGGVDSAVTAALLQRVIGNQLHCIYVDHGLMRAKEGKEVEAVFRPLIGDNFYMVDASEQFLKKLEGIKNPEKKRKIMGYEFVNVFDAEASKIEDAKFLAQGTLYTDIVESGKGGKSEIIKSHHNVGGLPADMDLDLVEPLRQLYKDEVRELGLVLGLSDSIVYRQPFPGPGLCIRIMGEITKEKILLVQQSDLILREEIAKAKLESEVWQYFTVLPGINTVGVRGDQRSYCDAIIIRAVCSVDGMTANVAELSYEVLHKISRRITNEIRAINRVLYDITDKPPGTIEFE